MFKSLSKKLAIDLGSAAIRIVALDDLQSDIWEISPLDFKAKVLTQPACLARRKDNHKLLAVGQEALAMRGRLESFAEIVFPFAQSRILDVEAASSLLKELLKKVFKGVVFNPSVMVTTTAGATAVTKNLLSQLFYDLGFARVELIAAPLAAAIGAGVPVMDSSGTLFLQMGASNLQFSAIALGSLLFNEDSFFAGDYLNQEIIDHLAHKENLAISWESAEKIKKEVFSLNAANKSMNVIGKTINGANPLELKIKSSDLTTMAEHFQAELLSLSQTMLAKVPPELLTDVLQKGLLLSGGLAQIDGLEDFLSQQLALPVALLDSPELLAILGAVAMFKR